MKRNPFIKYVEILTASDTCDECKVLAKKQFKLDRAPELPYEKCTHHMGCRCVYIPIVDGING